MAVFRIAGGAPLYGHVTVGGSKNSALAILAAAALAEGESVLENIPKHTDVYVMCRILEELGVRVWVDQKGRFHVDGRGLSRYTPSYDLARRIRGSIYTAGLLLARFGRAEVPLPGGCAIGSRGVDFHIKGFQQLGADVSIEHGLIKAETAGLVGTKIYINRASVGATVNMMLAAVLAKGTTVLENAAKEPEVVDLAIFLNAMGAKIRGAGTDVIKIQGVSKLQPAEYSIIPDRLEAGTFMIAVGACGGEVTLHNVVPEHLRTPVIKLKEAGLHIEAGDSELVVRSHKRPVSVDVETAVYPGFPTDLQQPFVAMMSVAEGTSVVRETIFSDRFRYVDELGGWEPTSRWSRTPPSCGEFERLTGAPVEVSDLRAGAALVIAALAADGETRVDGRGGAEPGVRSASTQKLRRSAPTSPVERPRSTATRLFA